MLLFWYLSSPCVCHLKPLQIMSLCSRWFQLWLVCCGTDEALLAANIRLALFFCLFFLNSSLIFIMHYDTYNQDGSICIGPRLNFPIDMVAVFVIGQYFDSQRKLMGTMFTDLR